MEAGRAAGRAGGLLHELLCRLIQRPAWPSKAVPKMEGVLEDARASSLQDILREIPWKGRVKNGDL